MPARDKSRARLRQRIKQWAQRLKVAPTIIRVQRMTRKWGSCSTNGIVTFANDLSNRRVGFQDFVIVHELLHLRIPNHGRVFKALMGVYVPGWRKQEIERTGISAKRSGW